MDPIMPIRVARWKSEKVTLLPPPPVLMGIVYKYGVPHFSARTVPRWVSVLSARASPWDKLQSPLCGWLEKSPFMSCFPFLCHLLTPYESPHPTSHHIQYSTPGCFLEKPHWEP